MYAWFVIVTAVVALWVTRKEGYAPFEQPDPRSKRKLWQKFFPDGKLDFFNIPADFWTNPSKYKNDAGWRIFLRATPAGVQDKEWRLAAAKSATGRKVRKLIGRRLNAY